MQAQRESQDRIGGRALRVRRLQRECIDKHIRGAAFQRIKQALQRGLGDFQGSLRADRIGRILTFRRLHSIGDERRALAARHLRRRARSPGGAGAVDADRLAVPAGDDRGRGRELHR